MNKWEKEVQRSLIKDEQRILRILQLMYNDVLREIQEKIQIYFLRITQDPTDAAAVYQFRYQQALARQISGILDGFEDKNYTSIQSYLEDCYTNGFVGAMYDIHRQGIPVVTPIRQENVVRAITTDSKISVPMYTRLGNNIAQLKTAIAAEVTRGIVSGHSWHDTAAGISRQGQVSAYNAMRIARTEGHRIACEAQMDGCQTAKAAGADVVKEWSAALDERTREHHRELNGQIRELDDAFEVAGIRVQYPGNFGRPEEDIHCRCALLQRARWALSEEELEKLRNTSAARGLSQIENFGEFKGKYLELAEIDPNVHAIKGKKPKKFESSVKMDTVVGGKPITEQFQRELSDEYDKFSTVFGAMDNVRSVTAYPYQNDGIWGSYNDNSHELFLFGAGGDEGRATLAKTAKKMKKDGKWSTASVYHTFRHEMGHALQERMSRTDPDYTRKLVQIAEIRKNILDSLTKLDESAKIEAMKKMLSRYGLLDTPTCDEFISECIAEYCDGKPRETAKSVVEILLKGGEENAG